MSDYFIFNIWIHSIIVFLVLAKLDELKRLKETFNNRKEDIANLHKYLEQLQISAREDDFDQNVKYMFYERQLKTFRFNFLKALSEVELPSKFLIIYKLFINKFFICTPKNIQ